MATKVNTPGIVNKGHAPTRPARGAIDRALRQRLAEARVPNRGPQAKRLNAELRILDR